MNNLDIIYRKLGELTDNPDNANTHPAKQLALIKRSIQKFGFISPVIVGEHDMIVCGHGRVMAARELGLEEVPTICITHLTLAQQRAYIIADNRVAESALWDEQKLAIEFGEILEMDGDIEVIDTGFELAEIDVIIEKSQTLPEDDPADEPIDIATVENVTRRGDLWLMGKHRLFCGDALDPMSYKALLGSEQAELVFTDPPYNCRVQGHVSGLGKNHHREFAMASGEMSDEEFYQFLKASCARIAEHTVDGAIAFICMDWRQLAVLLQAGASEFDELKALCVWDKQTGGMGSLYRSQHELVAVYKSGKAPHINNVALGKHGRNRTNVWSFPGMNSFGRKRDEKLALHPTVKNLAMVGEAILDCSTPGGLILDPYAGSGTTAIAAERTRRRAALIELDPHYCDIILRRFCDVTGIEPVNAATGQIVARRENDANEHSKEACHG